MAAKKADKRKDDLKDAEREEVRRIAAEDYRASRETLVETHSSKAEDYKIYRGYRDDATGGIGNKKRKGPTGWSSIQIPIAFWVVETELPRLGTQPPAVTVTPTNARSAQYAKAKQLRMNHLLRKGGFEWELITALKQMLILGKGPTKTTYCPYTKGPRMVAIDYFDYFLSPEATSYKTAEYIAHRTWWTPRMLRGLAGNHDADGNPIYDHEALEQLARESADRASSDQTWTDRRTAAGHGLQVHNDTDAGVVPVIEIWYRDGWVVTLGGVYGDHLLRIQAPDDVGRMRCNITENDPGRPIMPFVEFCNSPDLFIPEPISSVEMVADHQIEATKLRNLAMDQLIQNTMSPVVYDRSTGIRKADIDAAFGQPGGSMGVDGDPTRVVIRMPPGQMTGDAYAMTDAIRADSQMVAGVSDWAAGQTSSAGVQNQTATAVSIITGEGNKRFQFKTKLVQLAAGEIAQLYDHIDRQFNPEAVFVALSADDVNSPDAAGMTMYEDKYAAIDASVNHHENEYDIVVDAGSLVDPARSDKAQDLLNLIGLVSSNQILLQQTNLPELFKEFLLVSGLNPDRFMQSVDPMMMQQDPMAAMEAAMGGGGGGMPAPAPEEAPPAEGGIVRANGSIMPEMV